MRRAGRIRRPLMVRAALLRRSSDGVAAATELRRCCAQRCCDGTATESLLRRSCADQLRRAHSARRVRDGADAAETELMMRRSCCCDGAAAATELLLRRSCCCDGTAAATELLLRKSCCGDGAVQQQLHRAHSARRVSPYDFSLICSHLPPPHA